jgi:hypothetical protein
MIYFVFEKEIKIAAKEIQKLHSKTEILNLINKLSKYNE